MAYYEMQPFRTAKAVTPHNTNALSITPTRGLYVGVAGDLKVTMASGDEVTFNEAPVGVLDIQVTHVWSTGTAATDILALY